MPHPFIPKPAGKPANEYRLHRPRRQPRSAEACRSPRAGVEIPAYTTLDLNVRYAIDKPFSVFGTVRNLTDKKYIASRNPGGIFPGVERASYTF